MKVTFDEDPPKLASDNMNTSDVHNQANTDSESINIESGREESSLMSDDEREDLSEPLERDKRDKRMLRHPSTTSSSLMVRSNTFDKLCQEFSDTDQSNSKPTSARSSIDVQVKKDKLTLNVDKSGAKNGSCDYVTV